MTPENTWLHFVGIKGVGMSALAIVAKGMGYKVTGSDVAEEFITDSSLKEAGINPLVFSAKNISPEIDRIIVGAAYGNTHPEIAAAEALNIDQWTYSQLQGDLTRHKKTLAIAGTHGKTTITSLTAYLFYQAQQKPSWIIGTGHVSGLPSHGQAGAGDYFITEADDYKSAPNDPTPKFLDLEPYGAVVSSIEHDHPDLYPTLEDCIEAFRKFINRIVPHGFLVAYGDDKNIQRLLSEEVLGEVITYGFNDTNSYQIIDHEGEKGSHFSLQTVHGTLGPFTLSLPGKHNILNASAAIILALRAGIALEEIQQILPTFQTVERRYQLLGQNGDRLIIDDYAHHPTAISLTLSAAKKEYPDRPLWCIFQAHTYSRTKALLHEFGSAFGAADQVIITDIFASARETEVSITTETFLAEIQKHTPSAMYVRKDDIADYVRTLAPNNAVIITMGAGDIYKVGKALVTDHS